MTPKSLCLRSHLGKSPCTSSHTGVMTYFTSDRFSHSATEFYGLQQLACHFVIKICVYYSHPYTHIQQQQ